MWHEQNFFAILLVIKSSFTYLGCYIARWSPRYLHDVCKTTICYIDVWYRQGIYQKTYLQKLKKDVSFNHKITWLANLY